MQIDTTDRDGDRTRLRAQRGYMLLIVPIIIVAIAFFTIRAINRSRVSMRIAGSELNYEQTKMCAQQCASIAVNATARAMNGNSRVKQGSEQCPCADENGGDKIGCTTLWGNPAYSVYENCYGLQVVKAEMDMQVECKEGNDRAAKLLENVNFEEVPIFQFAVFYDKKLEIFNGPPMHIQGRVHSNDTLELYPQGDLFLSDWITSAETIVAKHHPKVSQSMIGFPLKDGSGTDAMMPFTNDDYKPLDQLLAGWKGFQKEHLIAYPGQPRGCGTIERLSVPTDGVDDPYELVQWRKPKDSYLLKRQKFAWRADLIFKDGVWMDNDLNPVSLDNPIHKPGSSMLEDSSDARRIRFWDNREQMMVKLLPVDVAKLQQRPGDSIFYLYDALKDPFQDNRDPGGFLLYNGSKLIRPMTIVTNSRVYMWGDFNVNPGYSNGAVKNNPYPAAIICDVFNELSNQWRPGQYGFRMRDKVSIHDLNSGEKTYLNACVMLGRGTFGYHNSLHFSEDWTNIPFVFTGSVVSLWDPHVSTQMDVSWYMPPVRLWSFDPMYKDITNMPPGTPRLVNPKLNTWEMRRE